jgi:hypothetical protein
MSHVVNLSTVFPKGTGDGVALGARLLTARTLSERSPHRLSTSVNKR